MIIDPRCSCLAGAPGGLVNDCQGVGLKDNCAASDGERADMEAALQARSEAGAAEIE